MNLKTHKFLIKLSQPTPFTMSTGLGLQQNTKTASKPKLLSFPYPISSYSCSSFMYHIVIRKKKHTVVFAWDLFLIFIESKTAASNQNLEYSMTNKRFYFTTVERNIIVQYYQRPSIQ